tara:strand:+ start:151 stop:1005 length:855 start_codon:yes stop_codon:yes gene_type:complete
MSSFLDSQKTQSLVGLANLAQTQQVNQNVKALQASQQEGNRLRSEQIQVEKIIAKINLDQLKAQGDTNALLKLSIQLQEAERTRIRIRDEEKDRLRKEIMEKKDALFQLRLDIKSISKGTQIHAVEKFYSLNAIAATLRELNINRESMVKIEDKQYLEDTFNQLNSLIESIYESLSEEEIKDIKTINKILSVDEESLIEEKEDQLKTLEQYKKYIKERIKIIEDLKEPSGRIKIANKIAAFDALTQRVIDISSKFSKMNTEVVRSPNSQAKSEGVNDPIDSDHK